MNRKYKCADIVMLVAAGTVVENFKKTPELFLTERPQWKPPFITDFGTQINDTLRKYLGINSYIQVKEATNIVNGLAEKAIYDLSMLKTQMGMDFEDDKVRLSILLEKLGFTKSWKKAQNHNQSSLIELLITFSNVLTPELKVEITGKGVNELRIDSVIVHADTLHTANINQESLKGTAKTQTATAIAEFNKVYKTAMKICNIGKKLFIGDPVMKKQYSFNALVKAQIAAGVGGEEAKTIKRATAKKTAAKNASTEEVA